ncbi:MAG: hypothetical protein JWP69_1848 [Flaviaesturariibacter sp.]|nr:hypothetical protein [Flaviaesturariibacter sp.]
MLTDKDKETSQSANGVVTVNDDDPTREERDQYIPNEPGTERLRSERQSVKDAEQKEESA